MFDYTRYNENELAHIVDAKNEEEAIAINRVTKTIISLRNELAAYRATGLSSEQVQELAKAQAERRLVMLPCKVGDMVYWADDGCETPCIHMGVIASFYIDDANGKLWFYAHYDDGLRYHHRADEYFNKTIFLTREAAEQELTGGGDND